MTQPSRDSDLWNQLGNAVSLASTTNQVVWTVFGIFWAANAVMLVALFTTGDLPARVPGLIVSSVGIALSFIWALIQCRAIRYLGLYEAIIERLENCLKVPTPVSLSRKINVELFKKMVGSSWWSVRPIMIGCAVISLLLWTWSFYWFLTDP